MKNLAALLFLSCLAAASTLGADEGQAPKATDDSLETPTEAELAGAVEEAIAYLLERQEKYEPDPPVGRLPDDELEAWQQREHERLAGLRAKAGAGQEWPYEGVYRVRPGGRIPPGYRVGGTAIVCLALLEAPGWADADERRAAVRRGTQFIIERIEEDPGMAPGPKQGYDVRGWGHVYALRFFLRGLDIGAFEGELRQHVEDSVPHLVHCVEVNEEPSGGWNYAGGRTSPFMTASTLIALFHANARGYEVDAEIVERALDALEQGRTSVGSFAYAGAATREVAMPGSAARSAAAELCLFRAGRSDEERLRTAVTGFFEGWDALLERKSQQGTHEGPYGIAPYYFFYGHTYAALASAHLDSQTKSVDREQLLALLWRTRAGDGGWNDRIFPRTSSYSTAMVLLALLAPDLPEVEAWPNKG